MHCMCSRMYVCSCSRMLNLSYVTVLCDNNVLSATPYTHKSIPANWKKAHKTFAGEYIYFFGVVDILQEYNLRKKLEAKIKRLLRKTEPSCVSSLHVLWSILVRIRRSQCVCYYEALWTRHVHVLLGFQKPRVSGVLTWANFCACVYYLCGCC